MACGYPGPLLLWIHRAHMILYPYITPQGNLERWRLQAQSTEKVAFSLTESPSNQVWGLITQTMFAHWQYKHFWTSVEMWCNYINYKSSCIQGQSVEIAAPTWNPCICLPSNVETRTRQVLRMICSRHPIRHFGLNFRPHATFNPSSQKMRVKQTHSGRPTKGS